MVHFGPRGDELVKQLAIAVLLASVDVGIGHRHALSELPAFLGRDDDHSGRRGRLAQQLPLFACEVDFGCYQRSYRWSNERLGLYLAEQGIGWRCGNRHLDHDPRRRG